MWQPAGYSGQKIKKTPVRARGAEGTMLTFLSAPQAVAQTLVFFPQAF